MKSRCNRKVDIYVCHYFLCSAASSTTSGCSSNSTSNSATSRFRCCCCCCCCSYQYSCCCWPLLHTMFLLRRLTIAVNNYISIFSWNAKAACNLLLATVAVASNEAAVNHHKSQRNVYEKSANLVHFELRRLFIHLDYIRGIPLFPSPPLTPSRSLTEPNTCRRAVHHLSATTISSHFTDKPNTQQYVCVV